MAQIVQQGAINTTALVVPDLYVEIVPPQTLYLNGVPTNVLGVVGTASWGPVNTPQICSNMADYARTFGPIMPRKYDLGTPIAAAVQQGASNFRGVRVTDGTDTGASCLINYVAPANWASSQAVTIGQYRVSGGNIWKAASNGTTGTTAPTGGGTPGLTGFNDGAVQWTLWVLGATTMSSLAIFALYTGNFGNGIQVSLSTGSKSGTMRLVIAPPGVQPEVFDNIAGTGTAFWTAMQLAVNFGNSVRGPSQFCGASGAGAGNFTATGVAGSTWNGTNNSTGAGSMTGMIGGTDGAGTVTAATLIGQDTLPRAGMYALRGQGCSVGVLADADDSTQWTTQAAFALSEGIYMVTVSPAGDTITNAVSVKNTAGLDCYGVKHMFGDWVWWNDQTNGSLRLISPQGFVAGRLANLSPEQSSLNKPLYAIVGTQKSGQPQSGQATTYSAAELGVLFQAGIDVISNPQPGGAYWGVRCGHNSSSNPATNGDNYTRLTNYIAATLAAGMGAYVGKVVNNDLFKNIRATLLSFFSNMLGQGMLAVNAAGQVPYGVICDTTNNPDSRTGLGYVQADCQVKYQPINEKFIVNIEGGQTVTVNRTAAAGS